jgi:hypothetical protein
VGEIAQDRLARYVARIESERETLEELAVRVAEGESLADVCRAWDVPHGRFAGWIAADPARRDIYDGALRLRADAEAAEAVRIADKEGAENTAHASLRVRVRQWAASKWDRARYGESVQVEHTGETVVRLTFGASIAAPVLVGSGTVADEDL